MRALRTLAALLLLVSAACDSLEPEGRLALVDNAVSGLGLRELPRATLRSIGLSYGLGVVRVEAAAARAGLRMGDVVYGVNQSRFENTVDFARLLAQQQPGAPFALLVRRGANDFYFAVDPALPRHLPATSTLLRT